MDNQKKANVLFVDDDQTFLRQLTRSVEHRTSAFQCHVAVCEVQAIDIAERIEPEVVVLDLGLDGGEPESGLRLLEKLLLLLDSTRMLILTGRSEEEWGVRCLNAGAASFLCKPIDCDHLIALIEDGINVSRLMRAQKADADDKLTAIAALGLSTRSPRMKKVLEQVLFAAATPQPILLCGETGVGKGVIAQAIHRGSSRSEGPFVRAQPSYGSHDLVSSELFGHTRGSFTGANEGRTGLIEEANGGTLFLDEVDALPHQTQVALLNVLQEKEFLRIGSNKKYRSDFRLISATNTPYEQLQGSKLRSDFFHRIAHDVIHIPALRERRDDIPLLAGELLNKLAAENGGGKALKLTSESCIWLSSQPWPGNVRELYATVESGYMRAKYHGRSFITVSDFQKTYNPPDAPLDTSLSEQLRVYELSVACTVFANNRQNYSATARALGIDRKRLKRILARAEYHV